MNLWSILSLGCFIPSAIAFHVRASSVVSRSSIVLPATLSIPSSISTQNGTFFFGSAPYHMDQTFYSFSSSSNPFSDEISNLKFVSSKHIKELGKDEVCDFTQDEDCTEPAPAIYPFAGMLRNSGRYIADHSNRIAVFYISSDYVVSYNGDEHYSRADDDDEFSHLMGDIALSWMLGMKIVLVIGSSMDVVDFDKDIPADSLDQHQLRKLEEEAGFVRFEIERTLNRHLRLHAGFSAPTDDAPAMNGNVVGGNFYSARPFGRVLIDDNIVDYTHLGYPSKVYAERIQTALDHNDIVLLSAVGTSRLGDVVVTANGHGLAATVASALNARKLIYLSHQSDAVLQQQMPNVNGGSSNPTKFMQEIPVTFARSLLQQYQVQINNYNNVIGCSLTDDNTGDGNSATNESSARLLLLQLAWATWALDQGVIRAHIINPGDGSLLEELFSSKLGVNTCLYREEVSEDLELD